jgi:hypothetical protein
MGRENVKIKRLWLLCPLVILALLICTIQAYAIAPIPHAFYGTLTISGSPAPVGTVVTAKVGGVQYGSITTTVEGQYGSSDPLEERLLVAPGEGEVAEGATIDFYVTNAGLGLDGVKTVETSVFDEGGVTELNLTVILTDDTTPPSVSITPLSPDPTEDTTPTFTGTATDTQSNIASVEYRVDSGSWVAATASDGAFDSLSEDYTFTTSTLSAGEHTVYVRATDAASTPNTTLEAGYATDTFTVAPSVLPGDANGDGVVNALDITEVERIIAMLDAETGGADANQDGVVNALDITMVEIIIVSS